MAETTDRTNQNLVIYTKDGTKTVEGEKGVTSVNITGLAAGKVVAAGDYQIVWSDGTNESSKVDVPAFTVPAAKPNVPSEVTAVPTADGATITGK